jgi:hypothetical protein
MKRTVEASNDDKKSARLLRLRRRSGRKGETELSDPESLPPGPAFPAARGLRTGALLSIFADNAVATQAAA